MGAKPLKFFPYFHANESHFLKRGLTLGSILKVRVFGTRKWSLFCLRSTNAKDVTICLVQSSYDFTRRAKFKTTWVCKNIFPLTLIINSSCLSSQLLTGLKIIKDCRNKCQLRVALLRTPEMRGTIARMWHFNKLPSKRL